MISKFGTQLGRQSNFDIRSASTTNKAQQKLNELTLSDFIRANTQNAQMDDTAFIVA